MLIDMEKMMLTESIYHINREGRGREGGVPVRDYSVAVEVKPSDGMDSVEVEMRMQERMEMRNHPVEWITSQLEAIREQEDGRRENTVDYEEE